MDEINVEMKKITTAAEEIIGCRTRLSCVKSLMSRIEANQRINSQRITATVEIAQSSITYNIPTELLMNIFNFIKEEVEAKVNHISTNLKETL